MELEARFTSPGQAVLAQARDEARLEREFTVAAEAMIEHVKVAALGKELTPGSVHAMWHTLLVQAMERLAINPSSDEGEFLLSSMLRSSLPDDAYSTASAVMFAAFDTYASYDELRLAMNEALALDEPSLLAAGGILSKLARVGMSWRNRIRRDVRTGFTGFTGYTAQRILTASQLDHKMWITRHDDAVRSTHHLADGQVVAVNAPFRVGGSLLMYPGDRAGVYEEIVNCRCVMVGTKNRSSS